MCYIQSSGEDLLKFKEVSVAPVDKHLKKALLKADSALILYLRKKKKKN